MTTGRQGGRKTARGQHAWVVLAMTIVLVLAVPATAAPPGLLRSTRPTVAVSPPEKSSGDVTLSFRSDRLAVAGRSWRVESRVAGGAWREIYRGTSTTQRVTQASLPAEFRVAMCGSGGSECGAFSRPVSLVRDPRRITVDGWPQVSLTPKWLNPDVDTSGGASCPVDTPPAASDWIGRIPATASVNNGMPSYDVPIALPPGRAGMTPAVALHYGGGEASGVAGVGWQVAATSRIHRCARTAALDGGAQAVLVANPADTTRLPDRLCLDGTALVLERGVHGQDGAEYRAENNRFDRIILRGSAQTTDAQPASCFVVERKSNVTRYYGNCATGRPTLAGAGAIERGPGPIVPPATTPSQYPLAWALAAEVDPRGNSITYVYTSTEGQALLNTIWYTGRYGVPVDEGGWGGRRVQFTYAARPDVEIGLRFRGVERRMTQRLTAITTRVGASIAARYELGYRQSEATGRSLLQTLTRCAAESCTASSSIATQFAYQESRPELGFVREPVPLADAAQNSRALIPDIDGDGRADYLEIQHHGPAGSINFLPETTSVYIGGWRPITLRTFEPMPIAAEMVLSGKGTPHRIPLVSNTQLQPLGGNFEFVGNGQVPFERVFYGLSRSSPVIAGVMPSGGELKAGRDIDGDGRADLLGKSGDFLAFATWRDSTASFWFRRTSIPIHDNPFGYRTFDFNGDGRLDVYHDESHRVELQCPQQQANQPLAFCSHVDLPFGASEDERELIVVELNGDGLPDFVFDDARAGRLTGADASDFPGAPRVYLSRGTYSGTPAQAYDWLDLADVHGGSLIGSDIRFADVNGDGLPDLVRVDDAIKVWLNRGGRFELMTSAAGQLAWPTLGYHAKIADFDGDGAAELLIPTAVLVNYCAGPFFDTPYAPYDMCSSGRGEPPSDGVSDFHHPGRAVGWFEDRGVYRWAMLDIDVARAGTPGFVTRRETSFEGPLSSDFSDWFGNGLAHGVMQLMPEYERVCYALQTSPVSFLAAMMCIPDAASGARLGRYSDLDLWLGEPNQPRTLAVTRNDIAGAGPTWTYDLPAGYGEYVYRQTAGVEDSAGRPDLLTAVTDGLGSLAEWRYALLSSDGDAGCVSPAAIPFYRNDGAPAADGSDRVIGGAMPVVSYHAELHGATQQHTCFRYQNARVSTRGRGFLGFDSVVAEQALPSQPEKNLRVETYYRTAFPYTGLAYETRTHLAADALNNLYVSPIARTTTTWNASCGYAYGPPASEPSPTGSCFVFEDGSTHERRDLVTRALLSTTTVDTSFDTIDLTWGNPTTVTTTVADTNADTAFVEQTTTVQYDYDYGAATAWWLDKLTRVDTTRSRVTYSGSIAGMPAQSAVSTARRFEYYADGHASARLPSASFVQEGVAGQERVTRFTYDANGNPDLTTESAKGVAAPSGPPKVADPANRVTDTDFGGDGYFVTRRVNAEGHVSTYTHDAATGQRTSETDQNNRTWTRTFDALGRLASATEPGIATVFHRIRSCATVSCGPGGVYASERTQRGTPATRTGFDRLLRPVYEETVAFDSTRKRVAWRGYDMRGNLGRATIPYEIAANGWIDFDAMVSTRWLDYDALGRWHRHVVETPDQPFTSRTTQRSFAGAVVTTTLPDGVLTNVQTIDPLGRLEQLRDAANGRMRYRYGATGNVVLSQDQHDNLSTHAHDALGRVIEVQDRDRGEHYYAYDGFGQLRHHESGGSGHEIKFDFDRLGRRSARRVDGAAEATWTYDRSWIGQLSAEWNAGAPLLGYERSFTYDYAGRPVQASVRVDARTFDSHTAYDCAGHRVGTIFPSGLEVGYAWSPHGYLLREEGYAYNWEAAEPGVPVPRLAYRTIEKHDPRGDVRQERYGNAVLATFDRDASTGQQRNHTVTGPAGNTLSEVAYTYGDAFGNLTQRENRALGMTETFGYDALQRIDWATRFGVRPLRPTVTVDYKYDALGNLVGKDDEVLECTPGTAQRSAPSFAGPAGLQRCTSLSGTAIADFVYDGNGNLLAGNGRQTTFDALDRVVRTDSATARVEFAYGLDADRVKRVESGVTTYLLDGGNYEHRLDAAGNLQMTHHVGPAALVAWTQAASSNSASDVVSYLHRDRLGSPALATDASGVLLRRYDFDAFGEPRDGASWAENGGLLNPAAAPWLTASGFTGHEHVDALGLMHMRGRVYDARLGRFLSPDPLSSNHGYAYVDNRATMAVDPTGYEGEPADGGSADDGGYVYNDPEVQEIVITGSRYTNREWPDSVPPGEIYVRVDGRGGHPVNLVPNRNVYFVIERDPTGDLLPAEGGMCLEQGAGEYGMSLPSESAPSHAGYPQSVADNTTAAPAPAALPPAAPSPVPMSPTSSTSSTAAAAPDGSSPAAAPGEFVWPPPPNWGPFREDFWEWRREYDTGDPFYDYFFDHDADDNYEEGDIGDDYDSYDHDDDYERYDADDDYYDRSTLPTMQERMIWNRTSDPRYFPNEDGSYTFCPDC